jgi:hypothetical protein
MGKRAMGGLYATLGTSSGLPHLGNSRLFRQSVDAPMLGLMNNEQIIEQYLEVATRRAYLLGAILGLAAGFVAGVLLWP